MKSRLIVNRVYQSVFSDKQCLLNMHLLRYFEFSGLNCGHPEVLVKINFFTYASTAKIISCMYVKYTLYFIQCLQINTCRFYMYTYQFEAFREFNKETFYLDVAIQNLHGFLVWSLTTLSYWYTNHKF